MNSVLGGIRRILALGLLIGFLIGLWAAIVVPIEGLIAASGEKTERSLQFLGRYQATARLKSDIEADLKKAQTQAASTPGLLEGNSTATAAARLQNDVRTIVAAAGGQIRSAQNMPSITDNGFEKIDIRFDFFVPINRLKEMLYQVEAHQPYLFVDSLILRLPETPQGEGTPPPNIDGQWTIAAYRWSGPR